MLYAMAMPSHVMKPLIMQFSPTFLFILFFKSKYSPQHHILKHIIQCTSLNVREKALYPFKVADKIIVLCILSFIFLDRRRQY